MNKQIMILMTVLLAWMLPTESTEAGDKPFPKRVPAQIGAAPEGFTIGKGHTAYNGGVDGSIYKMNLRSGEGEILVEAEPGANVAEGDCFKLGMRVDPRTNYLFVAGCFHGNAYVYDADTGEEIMKYQFTPVGESVINDIAITKDAVYFTDFAQPVIYSLPVSKNGGIPAAEDAAIAIPLTGDFGAADCCGAFANGIAATPDGKTLIVGHSGLSKIFRVDPSTGYAAEIIVEPPITEFGFIDAIVLHNDTLFILSPEPEGVYVVTLSKDMLSGELSEFITDPDLDGVASGAIFGSSLYVNNARYNDFPAFPTEYWVTKLNISKKK